MAQSSLTQYTAKIIDLPVLDFFVPLPLYLWMRLRQISIFAAAAVEVVVASFSVIKQQTLRRMFWGRGSLYKTTFHIVTISLTALLLVTGILSRFGVTQAKEALTVTYGTVGNNDFLEQGSTLTAALPIEDVNQLNYKVTKHVVKSDETLDSIASSNNVSKDTIKWANDNLLSPYTDYVQTGWELLIPQIDGVLHTAKSGETVDSIAALTGGNRFDIIEINELVPPSFNITEGQKIFVPGGKIVTPVYQPSIYGYGGEFLNLPLGAFPSGTFADPLRNADCSGYVWIRGYSPWHNGVDLALGSGCTIFPAAPGVVVYAGSGTSANCSYLCGNYIEIDHGNGVHTQYLHNEQLYVKTGDTVDMGTALSKMGCTGNCTGTHLHFTLLYNGVSLDPSPYVPYRRP